MYNLNYENLVVEPLVEMLKRIAIFIPTLVGVLVILIAGWIIAKIIGGIVNRLLNVIHFNMIADKGGISEVLRKGGLKTTASQIISSLVYWLIMIMVLIMVVNALGLTVATQPLEDLFAYIPNVIAALIILVLGMFLGNFVSGLVRTAAGNANIPKPEMFGGISKWAIFIFAITISFKELGIAPLLVTSTFNIFFGALCFALALAFGLGGKDIAAKFLEDLIKNQSIKE